MMHQFFGNFWLTSAGFWDNKALNLVRFWALPVVMSLERKFSTKGMQCSNMWKIGIFLMSPWPGMVSRLGHINLIFRFSSFFLLVRDVAGGYYNYYYYWFFIRRMTATIYHKWLWLVALIIHYRLLQGHTVQRVEEIQSHFKLF